MVNKDLIKLAEEYCIYYHQEQKRKGGNQDPYNVHPFAVREILVRYGYDDPETQAIALLHDTFEDTTLKNNKNEIEKRFGAVVYEGVYVLSNNTVGRNTKEVSALFKNLGVQFIDKNGILTPQAYKLRILFSKDTIKRVKIADVTDNTSALPDLSTEGIERKLTDADTFYIPLGRIVAPIMINELITNITNYRQSSHYQKVSL